MNNSRSAICAFLSLPLLSRNLLILLSLIVLSVSCDNTDPKNTASFVPADSSTSSTSSKSSMPGSYPSPNLEVPVAIDYNVVTSLPHDTNSFTEGLLIHDGQLFESTGHTDSYANSRSLFGQVDPHTGRIRTKAEIDSAKYFGEGIVFLKDRVYQLTNTTRIGFLYDAHTFKKLGEFHYDSDGWGLTTNGSYLIMSDGSSNITYRDPVTFKTVKTLPVSDNNGPVSNINELELIKGFIYANHWLTNYILKIDTTTGNVVGRLDLSSLKADALSKFPGSLEMNGIAYDTANDRILITGKFWPAIYQIKFNH